MHVLIWLILLLISQYLLVTSDRAAAVVEETQTHSWGDYIQSSIRQLTTRHSNLETIREMFNFSYTSYLHCAFPMDELNPMDCSGRGQDHVNKDNINVNDALGDYMLTMVDSLDTLVTSPTALPYPRFHIASGLRDNTTSEACLAGAGSLFLEFGCLSALLNDSTYATVARQVVLNLWNRRSNVTGLLGSTIDVNSGQWMNQMTGIGAGQDSFYEYLHKTAIIFDDGEMGSLFDEALSTLRFHLLNNQSTTGCLTDEGYAQIYWNVNMYTGTRSNFWIDSLQFMWPGLLAQHGDISEAVCQHTIHYFIWQLYGLPPERYNVMGEEAVLNFFPLRPEFAESTYHLYRATRHPFYLRVGQEIMDSLNTYARVRYGFTTIHNVRDMSQEDRMESFFLSETLKYLYLLFDDTNPINVNLEDYMFSTQAHLFPVRRIRKLFNQLQFKSNHSIAKSVHSSMVNGECSVPNLPKSALPMDAETWHRIGKFVHSKLDTRLL